MDGGVVKEEIDLLVTASISHLFKEADELFLVEAILLNSESKKTVT